MIKRIHLVFDGKDYKLMEDKKTQAEKLADARLSWEDFVFKTVCGK